MRRLLALGLFIFPGAVAGRTLDVGPNQPFAVPSAAAAAARDGDRIAIHAGTYSDCAVWTANRLTIEGIGPRADDVTIADKSCQGKALFVTVGEGIVIRNLTLTHARVPDGNGAGVRAEGRDLTVVGVRFVDNQNGILSGMRGGTVTIRDSLFDRNGTCEQACAHGIYIGPVDRLIVANSHFIGTNQGHHIKSRALRTEVVDCTIEDGPTGTASYAIDVPNGGDVLIRGNTLQKGPRSENRRALIAIGEEGVTNPMSEIVIEANRIRNDAPGEAAMLLNRTTMPAVVRGNRIFGLIREP